MSKLIRDQDFIVGLVFISFGVGYVLLGQNLPFGNPRRMGPAFFPFILAGILVSIGLMLALKALRKTRRVGRGYGGEADAPRRSRDNLLCTSYPKCRTHHSSHITRIDRFDGKPGGSCFIRCHASGGTCRLLRRCLREWAWSSTACPWALVCAVILANEVFDHLTSGFSAALSPSNLLYCFIGVFLGTLIGVLPGLGPLPTIAMLLPLTFGLPSESALIMLAGIYYGAQYGGSTTAILINLPGKSSSVVTALDGYQLAKQGRAGEP